MDGACMAGKHRRYDEHLRQATDRQWDALNPIPFVAGATPAPDTLARPMPATKGLRGWEKRLAHHQALYARWLGIYGRRLDPESPLKQDIRYWEARIAKIDVRDWNAFFWFFGLGQIQIADLCWLSRRCREIYYTKASGEHSVRSALFAGAQPSASV